MTRLWFAMSSNRQNNYPIYMKLLTCVDLHTTLNYLVPAHSVINKLLLNIGDLPHISIWITCLFSHILQMSTFSPGPSTLMVKENYTRPTKNTSSDVYSYFFFYHKLFQYIIFILSSITINQLFRPIVIQSVTMKVYKTWKRGRKTSFLHSCLNFFHHYTTMSSHNITTVGLVNKGLTCYEGAVGFMI